MIYLLLLIIKLNNLWQQRWTTYGQNIYHTYSYYLSTSKRSKIIPWDDMRYNILNAKKTNHFRLFFNTKKYKFIDWKQLKRVNWKKRVCFRPHDRSKTPLAPSLVVNTIVSGISVYSSATNIGRGFNFFQFFCFKIFLPHKYYTSRKCNSPIWIRIILRLMNLKLKCPYGNLSQFCQSFLKEGNYRYIHATFTIYIHEN